MGNRRSRRSKVNAAKKRAKKYPPLMGKFIMELPKKFLPGDINCENEGCENQITLNTFHTFVYPEALKFKTIAVCHVCLAKLSKEHGGKVIEGRAGYGAK